MTAAIGCPILLSSYVLLIVLPFYYPFFSWGYVLRAVLVLCCLGQYFGNMFKLVTTDPNGTKADLPSIASENFRYCNDCRVNAPMRAFHCPGCNRFVSYWLSFTQVLKVVLSYCKRGIVAYLSKVEAAQIVEVIWSQHHTAHSFLAYFCFAFPSFVCLLTLSRNIRFYAFTLLTKAVVKLLRKIQVQQVMGPADGS